MKLLRYKDLRYVEYLNFLPRQCNLTTKIALENDYKAALNRQIQFGGVQQFVLSIGPPFSMDSQAVMKNNFGHFNTPFYLDQIRDEADRLEYCLST